jgi:predicted transcriptional regulator YdeE
MYKKFGELLIAGIAVSTNNTDEMSPDQGKIGPLVQSYFSQNVMDQIENRTAPGNTYIVYTDFESDENGQYTCLIGEEVTESQSNSSLKVISIPASKYKKFTTRKGPIPDVVIESWQKIWKTTDFGGKRTYQAEFELYDHRVEDPTNAEVDIFIGIEEAEVALET